jgi:hypothetical protein
VLMRGHPGVRRHWRSLPCVRRTHGT